MMDNVLKTEKNHTGFSKILAGYPLYISDEVSIIKEVQRQLAKSAKEYACNDREYTAVS